ncbi:10742_t:CDS:1, partial [Racocetra fulgida]
DYIAELISNAENNNGISVEVYLDLNNDIFSIAMFDDSKTIVRIIIDKIEEGDGYAWTATTSPNISTRFDNVVTYYFACSQCHELERKYKESNRKRITRFDCHGKLIIHVNVPAIEATIKLCHDILHEEPEDNTVLEEVKQAIQANLHLDSVQI